MTLTEEEFKFFWGNQEVVLHDIFNNELDLNTAAQKLAAIVLPEPAPDQDDDDEDDNSMVYIEAITYGKTSLAWDGAAQ